MINDSRRNWDLDSSLYNVLALFVRNQSCRALVYLLSCQVKILRQRTSPSRQFTIVLWQLINFQAKQRTKQSFHLNVVKDGCFELCNLTDVGLF